MKGETREIEIKEISLNDFVALGLEGYKKEYVYVDDATGKCVSKPTADMYEMSRDELTGALRSKIRKGISRRFVWNKKNLGELAIEGRGTCVVALYDEVSEDDIKNAESTFSVEYDEAKSICLDNKCYKGYSTYIFSDRIVHLYSKRNWFYNEDRGVHIPKMRTRCVYLVKR